MNEPPQDAAHLLEVIRRKEAEVKRRLASERDSAEASLRDAQRLARRRWAEAEAEGRRQGEAHRAALVAEAEREAQAIVERAQGQAQEMLAVGRALADELIEQAVEIVLGGGG